MANYSVQAMGSPDYVGAVHKMLDGTMLDLNVSADFLRGGVTVAGVIVACDVTVGGVILRYEVAVVDVSAGSEVAEGGMMVRCQVAVVDMIMGPGFAGGRSAGRTKTDDWRPR